MMVVCPTHDYYTEYLLPLFCYLSLTQLLINFATYQGLGDKKEITLYFFAYNTSFFYENNAALH